MTTTDVRHNVAKSEPHNAGPAVEIVGGDHEPATVGLPSDQLARLASAAAHTAAMDPGASPVLNAEAMARVLAAVDASTAEATKTAYRSDWNRFTTWCSEQGSALPAAPAVVAAYITAAATEVPADRGRFAYADLRPSPGSTNR